MKVIIYPSGKEVREYSWHEWRNRELKEKPKLGIVKSKNKSNPK